MAAILHLLVLDADRPVGVLGEREDGGGVQAGHEAATDLLAPVPVGFLFRRLKKTAGGAVSVKAGPRHIFLARYLWLVFNFFWKKLLTFFLSKSTMSYRFWS